MKKSSGIEQSTRYNRLRDEVSPYLRQHAGNPVDWFPWGDEAFVAARERDRPIFLSIGYSTCHWCHVMERESFSDSGVAALMNEHFVSIKVDREERPDLDNLYMNAAIALTGTGGWPLNLVLTPDLHPFYAATYLPKEGRPGLPGLMEVLPALARFWREHRERAVESAGLLVKAIHDSDEPPGRGKVRRDAADRMIRDLTIQFDSLNGGFGRPPKFPMPHLHLFLLRFWKWTGNEKALRMAEKTLLGMARGGIYDHLGCGFHRYATDARWLVPHFEKMLYDQALAGMAYAEAYLATGNPEFGEVANGCMEYTCSRLVSDEGGLFSAEDADSEGKEGKYYLWTKEEISSILEPDDQQLAFLMYPVSNTGNFPDPAEGGHTGLNILHRIHSVDEAARILQKDCDEIRTSLNHIRDTLLHHRESRVRPFRDEKILADWNGLAVGALAMASRALEKESFLAVAGNAASFILSCMRMDDGGLYHRYKDGVAGIPATSADYAGMIFGLLELFIASGEPWYLESALALEEYHVTHFWDHRKGAYFTSSKNSSDLFARQKEFTDGAIPSPNSLSFSNLVRLALLTGEEAFSRRAGTVSRYYSRHIERHPMSCGMFMAGYTLYSGPLKRAVISGKKTDPTFREMRSLLNLNYLPYTVPLLIDTERQNLFQKILPATREYIPLYGKTTAYVCSSTSCMKPVFTAGDLKNLLGFSTLKRSGQGD